MTAVWLSLVAAAILLISPLGIWVDYRHRGKSEDSLLMQIQFLWGLGKFSVQVPVISASRGGLSLRATAGKQKKRIGIAMPSRRQFIRRMTAIQQVKGSVGRFLRLFRRSVKIKKLVWHTQLGINDSARLAQLTGMLWAVKGMVCAGAYGLFRFTTQPVLRVQPQYNRNFFRTVFSCILEFPLGYAIIAAFFAVYLVLKLKLSRRGEENVGTSNSGPDENSDGKYQGNGGCQYSNR